MEFVYLLQYLDSTIQQMAEAWEDILLEIDSKLMKFAAVKAVSCFVLNILFTLNIVSAAQIQYFYVYKLVKPIHLYFVLCEQKYIDNELQRKLKQTQEFKFNIYLIIIIT